LVVGQFVTPAIWNLEVRDALAGIQAAPTAYTPTLTSTTSPTLGTGSSVIGRYQQVGHTLRGWFFITFGTSGAAAGAGFYQVSIPVPMAGAAVAAGLIQADVEVQIGGLVTPCRGYGYSGGLRMRYASAPINGTPVVVGPTNPAAFTNNATISGTFAYEV